MPGIQIRELSVLQDSGLSVRERNRAKRKARQLARRPSVDTDSIGRRYARGGRGRGWGVGGGGGWGGDLHITLFPVIVILHLPRSPRHPL